MKKRKPKLRACEVTDGCWLHVGFLYFETDSMIVLLNNVGGDSELGPLKMIRHTHREPEADVDIYPKAKGYRIISVDRLR